MHGKPITVMITKLVGLVTKFGRKAYQKFMKMG